MKIHPGVKPAVWGAVVGAVAFAVVGFSSLGWTLGSTAEKMATQRAETAVVAVLAPICVEKFQQQTDAAAKLVAFNKISSSWDRRSLIEKGGWATVPGTDKANSAVVSACAEKLGSLTSDPTTNWATLRMGRGRAGGDGQSDSARSTECVAGG